MRKLFASALVFTLAITSAAGLRASEPQAKDIVDCPNGVIHVIDSVILPK